MQRKSLFELRHVVVFEHQGVLHHLGRHTRASGVAKGGQARARFDQQRVGMAVVATLKLDDLAAACGSACQAQRTHARFGAGADQTHHFHGGHVFQDFFGQLNLALGGRAEREAVERRFLHGLKHSRVAVAQDHGAPRADVVDVLLAVGIPKVSALCALHKAGRAAHGAKGTHGRVDAAGNHVRGTVKQGLVQVGHGFLTINVWFRDGATKSRRPWQACHRCLRLQHRLRQLLPKTCGQARCGPYLAESRC